jgi:phage tail sheath protein FI
MMAFEHGVSTRQLPASAATPVTAATGIPFAVGTAPVHTVSGGKVNEPVLCLTYDEAAAALGYGDDWEKYSLCEVMYSHFKLFAMSPVVFLNVLDPAVHKTHVGKTNFVPVDNLVTLPLEVIAPSLVVGNAGGGGGELEPGVDYDVVYSGGGLIVELFTAGITEISAEYDAVDPGAVDEDDIIGGFDPAAKKSSGLELIDAVFPKYGIVPDIILAPGWSHRAAVAAVMAAKASNINGVFGGKAYIDVDTAAAGYYSDVPEWKKDNNIFSKFQVLFFPKVKLGDRVFHLSTQAAGLTAAVDGGNGGVPSESPSNKGLQMDSAVLADGTEVLLDVTQANYLNSQGVVTALNWIGGYKLWGNSTACFPGDTDVKNYFLNVSRMFGWVANSLVLTYWSKVDGNMTRRLIDTIVDSVNIWLNGLVNDRHLLGGRVEFRGDENPETALMAGKMLLHVFLTPPSPAQEIEFVLEYDVGYVRTALA